LGSELQGRVIDTRFEILEKLGEGGMGAIYKARQLRLDRIVALKILLHDRRGDAISVERFRHEAYLASRLRHPHAIHVYDFGQAEDGLLYIAMEFLEGETLKERMEHAGALSVPASVQIISQTLRTITEAHRLGLIHRDLKPDNIFLARIESNVDYVKVLDFGIAKLTAVQDGLVEGYRGGLTLQGKIYGTPNYMSPEQIRGKTVDHQSDLYSLGVLFFEMLTGERPFDAETPVEVMMMHLRDDAPALTDIDPELPKSLNSVIQRALAKDRRERFQSGQEFLDTLQAFRADSGFYRLPIDGETSDESDPSMDATVIPGGSLSGSVLHLSLDSSAIQAVGQFEASDPGDDLDLDDEKTVLELGVSEAAEMEATANSPAAAKVSPPAPLAAPETEAMPTPAIEENDPPERDGATETMPGARIDGPDTITSARRREEIEADGSLSFLSVDMESLSEDEATFLELAEDEYDEVEQSRLVPIPDLAVAPARLPAPTAGGLPPARALPDPVQPLVAPIQPLAAPIQPPPAAVPVAAQIRPPVVVRLGSQHDLAAPAALTPQPAPVRPVHVYDATGPVMVRRTSRKRLALKLLTLIVPVIVGAVLVIVFLPDLFESGPPPGPLQLEISSDPSPIEVFDNNRYIGETQLSYPLAKPTTEHKMQFGVGGKTYRATLTGCDQQTWIYVSLAKLPKARVLGAHLITTADTPASVEVEGKVRGQTPLWLVGPGNVPLDVTVIGAGGQRVVQRITPTADGGQTEVSLP
jgi:serine/threonine protein kinase